jgi:galactoside O-acetyltransferase
MGYLNESDLLSMNFRFLGRNVLVSDKASLYFPSLISLGDNSRVDDFCVLSGDVTLGRNTSVAVFCNLAAGRSTITLGDFTTLAYGCHIVAQSDDYSGATMTNPTVPREFKNETSEPIRVGDHAILGTNTVVLPGVEIPEGVASGAGTVFVKSAEPWSIYVGAPARRISERSRNLLTLKDDYLRRESI